MRVAGVRKKPGPSVMHFACSVVSQEAGTYPLNKLLAIYFNVGDFDLGCSDLLPNENKQKTKKI